MFFFQLVIMSGTVLLAYYMECTDLFSVHVQGFFCNDAELMKPYPGTEESSFVPPLILYCVVAAAPTAIVSKNPFYVYFPAVFKTTSFLKYYATFRSVNSTNRMRHDCVCSGSVPAFMSSMLAASSRLKPFLK